MEYLAQQRRYPAVKRNWVTILLVVITILTLILALPAQAGGPGNGNGGGQGNGQGSNGNGNGNGNGGSGSDPDNNGNGPDRDFDTNGPDKVANGGDNNNGIGNDADCGDDAENVKLNPACVRKLTPTPIVTPTPPCPVCPTPTPCPPTPTPRPSVTPTPDPGCGRVVEFYFLREVLEIYPHGKIPKDPWGWIVDFPPGMVAGMTVGCHESVDLYWWNEQEGWSLIGTLTTFGPGGTIRLNLAHLFSYSTDNYRFEVAN